MSKRVIKIPKSSWVARKNGFKSGLEESISSQITLLGFPANYETEEIAYKIPESKHVYHPDFVLPNGIYIETKGRLMAADRKKHILIKKQHPDKDIRFVFSNCKNKISKKSKTTYADWCEKHGFKYANKTIPVEWFESINPHTPNKWIK